MRRTKPGRLFACLLCAMLLFSLSPARAGDLLQPGDTLLLGRYPQSSLGTARPAGEASIDWMQAPDLQGVPTYYAVEPISWLVLEASEEALLLLSEAILDVQPYQAPLPSVPWADCTLRVWLNDDFLTQAFLPAEQGQLLPAPTGEGITDRVFCLSPAEYASYLPAIAPDTGYAADRTGLHADYWWLRTPPGGAAGFAAYIDDRGKAFPGTHHVFYALGVRPAIMIAQP